MSDLVERYVHQVGSYVPADTRREIEAELRSQIHDQLEDRYPHTPTDAEIAAVLVELGSPQRFAASYDSERYLVGPTLYPVFERVLVYGLRLFPSLVVFLNIFNALTAPQPIPLVEWLLATIGALVQTMLMFSAVVVLLFALVERNIDEFRESSGPFDPRNLPKVDDPSAVDRIEAAGGLVIGTLVTLVLLYFLSVGGLTASFNPNAPGEVIPVPTVWLVVMPILTSAMTLVQLVALRRKHWTTALWQLQTSLETIGVIGLYFVLYKPLFDHVSATSPEITTLPIISSLPEIIVVVSAVVTLVSRGFRLIKLWQYTNATAPTR